MSELELQKIVLMILRKKIFRKSDVFEEKAHLNGSTDIVISNKKSYVCIEIKKTLNSRVFEQLSNQKLFATHLVAIAHKPKTKKTLIKWEKLAKEKMINIIYFENGLKRVKKRNFLKIQNENYDYNYSRKVMIHG